MAIPGDTRQTYGAVQIREDLSNIIYNISPTDTPFISGAGRGTASNTLFQWQKDSLAPQAVNRKFEGDNPTNDAVVEPVLLNNHTQISVKAIQTSGTAEAVDFAGRKSSQAYRMAKAAKELKRDMEFMLTGETVKAAGSAVPAARVTGELMTWLGTAAIGTSNIVDGSAGGTTGVGIVNAGTGTSKAAPAGADAVLHMDMVNNCIERIFNAGGEPDVIMCDSSLKVKMSALAGSTVADIVTNHDKASPATSINSVDVIVTDFGTYKIVPNRFCLPNQLYVLDYDFWSVDYLRPFSTQNLAKTGDSIQQMMLAEYGLRGKNGQASGAIIGVKAS
tara:strand:+ start:7427 stop:8425 length:999 start_codon:yes stop_codon:yes gene_type:complete